jgi:hypothetical protein
MDCRSGERKQSSLRGRFFARRKEDLMKSTVGDTTPEAEQVLIAICRKMSVQDRWRRLQSLYRTGRDLHEIGYRQRHPDATPEDIVDDWLRLTLDPEVYREVRISIHGSL